MTGLQGMKAGLIGAVHKECRVGRDFRRSGLFNAPEIPSSAIICKEMLMSLAEWSGVPLPQARALNGTYVRLEPLDPGRHAQPLFAAATGPAAEELFRYLPDRVPQDPAVMRQWATAAAASTDPLFFAVIDRASGRAEGRQALMRMDAVNGVIEIGNILWGPRMARTRLATEAFFLFADHIFGLGYRRLEWKCNDENLPSKRAAERFGFRAEGVFRQHMVVKGKNRDTAWFAILDGDWPRLRDEYRRWLAAGNFDANGTQHSRLNCRPANPRS
jgi:RimJ/RimL family protein N-acetyltransferase